jgi:hypothetical protein
MDPSGRLTLSHPQRICRLVFKIMVSSFLPLHSRADLTTPAPFSHRLGRCHCHSPASVLPSDRLGFFIVISILGRESPPRSTLE